MEKSNLPAVIQTAITTQGIDLSKVNLMLPTQSFGEIIGDYDKVVIETIKIDPDPKKGDVYEIKDGEKSLGKRPIMAIANALGIIWDPANTGIIESTETKARAKATGGMRKPNGEWIILPEEKTIDVSVIEEEQRIKYEEDAEKGKIVGWEKARSGKSFPKRAPWGSEEEKQKYIELAVRKAILPVRKFKDEKANTGAKERVVKAFVALKKNYTAEELSKPIAFPRVILDTSKMLDDPRIRDAAIGRMTGAVSNIFGKETERDVTPKPLAIDIVETATDTAQAEIVDATRMPVNAEEEPEPETDAGFDDDIPWETAPTELNPVDALRKEIVTLINNPLVPPEKKVEIGYWLEKNADAKIAKKLENVKTWLQTRIDSAGGTE